MNASTDADGGNAPWLNLSDETIMSVEHPCIVRNSGRAIEMLGGPRALSQTMDLGTERTLALSFAPDDPSSRTVLSLHHQTNDILLKVTVPRRTGRKRKRGTNEPFVEDPSTEADCVNASYIVRSMRDNPTSCNTETVGSIASAHVWRSMPDFVFSSKGSSFMKSIEKTLLPKNYDSMKQFHISRAYGCQNTESIPPAILSTQSMPYHYFYRQNQAILKGSETNGASLVNRTATTKTFTHQWQFDNEHVPQGPMKGCPPLEDQPQQIQDIVDRLRPLFDKRPLWTRRALLNQLPNDTAFFFAKNAMAYVAFTIRSGPWRDTLCKFGVDPRTDRKYRKFQTILLQILQAQRNTDQTVTRATSGKHWVQQRDSYSHVFTGTKDIPADGKVWQLCDLEDEQLKILVDVEDFHLRPECEIRYFGWYPNGVYAKLKILLKVKVDRLIAGRSIDPSLFDLFMKLPHQVDVNYEYPGMGGGDLAQGYLPKDATKDELDWATSYRGVVRTPIGAVPVAPGTGKGRANMQKSKARPGFIDTAAGVADEHIEDIDMDPTDLE